MASSDQVIHESSVEDLLRSIEDTETLSRNKVDQVREFISKADQFWISAEEHTEEQLPRQLGRFRLLKLLGEGGFGVVYLAEDTDSGKEVALKLPRPERLLRPDWRKRFLREARAVSVLTHDSILRIYDAGETEGQWYISCKYCPGPNLAQWLKVRSTSVGYGEAAQFLSTLAGAMAHAHERGVIHRDLKPSNILLQPKEATEPESLMDFTPCIADFGLAKLIEESGAQTRSGVLLGTVQYMAPEQAEMKHQEVCPATDIYALGLILYEVLTRQAVVPAEPMLHSLREISHAPAPRLRALRPDCPADLETIYLKCLEKNPRKRYGTAKALHDDIERFLQGQSIVARPVSIVRRLSSWVKREPVFATILLFSVVILMLVLVGVLIHAHQTDQSNERYRAALHRTQQMHYLSTIQRASQLVESGDAAEACQLLSRSRDEQMELQTPLTWEWRYLWNRVQKMPRHYRWLGHHETPYALAYSPKGNLIATSDGLGVTIIRDADTGQELKTFQDQNLSYTPMWFSPDGSWLAQYSSDKEDLHHTLYIWDTRTWTLRNSITLSRELITGVCFQSQSNVLVMCTALDKIHKNQGRLLTWKYLETEAGVVEINSGMHSQRLLWSEAHKSWMVVGISKILLLDEQFHIKSLAPGPTTLVKGVAVSLDGRWSAWANLEGEIMLYDLKLSVEQPVRSWRAHPTLITQLDFHHDSMILASCGSGHAIHLWDVQTGKLLHSLEAKGDTYGVTFASDGRSLFFGSTEDFAVHRWYYADDSSKDGSTALGDQIWCAAMSTDGNQLMLGLDDDHSPNTLRTLDIHRAEKVTLKTCNIHEATVTGIVLLEESKQTISSSLDGELLLHDWKTGARQAQANAHENGGIRRLIALGAGAVATSGQDGLIRMWDHHLQPIGQPLNGHGGKSVTHLVYHPGSASFYSVGDDRRIVQWDMATQQPMRSLEASAEARSICLSHDQKHLAIGTKLGDVYLVSLKDWRIVQQYHLQEQSVTSLVFTPDDRSLIGGDFAGNLFLWEVESGQLLLKLPAHQNRISALLWGKDGTRLFSTSMDGRVFVHDFR